MNRLLALLFSFLALASSAQSIRQVDNQTHVWLLLGGNHRVTENWGVHTDVQIRRADGVSSPQQFIARVGLEYRLRNGLILTAGYCWVHTSVYGRQPSPKPFYENRGWQQLAFDHFMNRIRFLHRYRLENRWVERYNVSSDRMDIVYSNRIRYRIQLQIPLNKTSVESGTWMAIASNEIYINFGRNIQYNIFDQNRYYGGIGYQISTAMNMQLGYLNQRILKSDGVRVENNRTIQLSCIYNLDLRKRVETNQ